jgi:hypothetical protein
MRRVNVQMVGAIFVVTLLFARVACGQATPAPRGLVGVMGGLGILTASGDRGAPVNGAGPMIVGSLGVAVRPRMAVEAEAHWLRISEPYYYKGAYRNTVRQLQFNGLVRWSRPGSGVDIDYLAGAGIVQRDFSSTLGVLDLPSTGFNVEVGFDVTRWMKNTGLVFGLRTGLTEEARSGGDIPRRPIAPMLLLAGGIRGRF